ncbi:hypothetical protein ALC53_00210, partial [Atta colombica]
IGMNMKSKKKKTRKKIMKKRTLLTVKQDGALPFLFPMLGALGDGIFAPLQNERRTAIILQHFQCVQHLLPICHIEEHFVIVFKPNR